MSKKLIAAIILLVLQIIAMLGSALSDAAKAGANGLGAVMSTLGFSAFTIVAIVLIAVELRNVYQPKQENTINQSFKNRRIDDTSDDTQAITSDYIPEHELKKVKSTLEHNRTYYFDNSDIHRLYQMSLIDGELDIPLLKNNVYTFDDEVADKQNEIEQIVQEQVPYFSREYALKHACRYAKAHNATREDVTKYLDSLYGEM